MDNILYTFDQIPSRHEEQGLVVRDCPKRKGVSYAVAGFRATVSKSERKKTWSRRRAFTDKKLSVGHVCELRLSISFGRDKERKTAENGNGAKIFRLQHYRSIWNSCASVCFFRFDSFHRPRLHPGRQQDFNHAFCHLRSRQNVSRSSFCKAK